MILVYFSEKKKTIRLRLRSKHSPIFKCHASTGNFDAVVWMMSGWSAHCRRWANFGAAPRIVPFWRYAAHRAISGATSRTEQWVDSPYISTVTSRSCYFSPSVVWISPNPQNHLVAMVLVLYFSQTSIRFTLLVFLKTRGILWVFNKFRVDLRSLIS